MPAVVVNKSTWVVGSMCHCRGNPMEGPDEDCDDHWQVWVTPIDGEIGRYVVADAIQQHDTAAHIVALHNAVIAAGSI